MRPTARLIAILACSLPFAAALAAPPPDPISAEQLLARQAQADPGLAVLDVRSPAEYAEGHVPGAVNVPQDQLEARLAELEGLRERDVVLYCRTGRRAALAAEVLGRHGFAHLRHLTGDMAGWLEAGRPVEKPPAPPAAAAPQSRP